MRCAEPRPGVWHRRAAAAAGLREAGPCVTVRPYRDLDADEDNGGGRHGEAGARLVRVRTGHGGDLVAGARAAVGRTGAEPTGRSWPTSGGSGGGPCGVWSARPAPTWAPPFGAALRDHLGVLAPDVAVVDGVLARLRPRERAGRARGMARRAGSRPRGGGGDRLPAPGVRAGRPAGVDGPQRPVGSPPGQGGDGQRGVRAGLVGAPLRGLCDLPRDRGRAPHGAAAARPGPGRHARRGQAAGRQHRAGCGRADRGRRTTDDTGAQRLPGPGAVLRRRDVRTQCRA